jgi:hypothetical protein
MKNRITAVILMLVLGVVPATPVFGGFSAKIPETATVGEAFTIATTAAHAYAIQDGILWAWGNEYGGVDEEGYAIFKRRPAPKPIMENVTSVRTNGDTTFVLKTDGTLWSWGFEGTDGILGDNRAGNTSYVNSQGNTHYQRLDPAQIMDGVSAICAEMECGFAFAIKEDGSLWGWGGNESYQLGDGTRETHFIPVKIMDDVKSVRIMNDEDDHYDQLVYAVKTDGSLWKWGTDYNEVQIGDNPFGGPTIGKEVNEEFPTPTLVTENAADIIAGFANPNLDADGNYHHKRYGNETIIPDVAEVTDSGYSDYLWRKKDGTVWYDGRNGGNPNYDGSGEIVLKEDAAAKYYYITFDLNGGQVNFFSSYHDTTDRDGRLIALPKAHGNEPYGFIGWFTDPNGGALITIDTVFTSDSTVYAHWGPYVPVTDITGLPTEAVVGTDLILTGTAAPSNATEKHIIWSVQDPGTTGVADYLSGGVFSATAAGTAVIRARITDGLASGVSYTKDFTITVSAAIAESPGVPTPEKVMVKQTGGGAIQFDYQTVLPGSGNRQVFMDALLDMGASGEVLILGGGKWYNVNGITLAEAAAQNRLGTPAAEYQAVLESGVVTTPAASALIDRINQSYPLSETNAGPLYAAYQALHPDEQAAIADEEAVLDLLALAG